jgi:exodeoxyribonuclease V
MSIKYSPGQQKVFDDVMAWHAGDQQTFVLAGYAGTGKTTLARGIADAIDPQRTLFAAFTGKAANVLREKGCHNAGTLHSFIYSLIDHNKAIIKQLEDDIISARAAGDGEKLKALLNLLEQKRMEFRRPKFDVNPDSPLKTAPLVIVDEYSMLSEKLITDLQKSAKKILYLGDPFQLPPVEGLCPLSPTAFLTEIHRQALESPIIRAATMVREGKALAFGTEPGFAYQPRAKIAPEAYAEADQIIVGRNITRAGWNRRFRTLKGYDPADLPHKGEKMICLKNDPSMDLFNGMIGEADSDARHKNDLQYTLDFDGRYSLPVFAGDVRGESDKYDGYNEAHKRLQRFDYAYAITCHKSQGSEFGNVLVYHEPIGRGVNLRRWSYTAITRAQENCTLVEP